MSALKIFIILFIVVALGLLAWLVYTERFSLPANKQSPLTNQATPSASLTPVSSEKPITVTKLEGTVVSITGNDLVLSIEGKNQNISLIGVLSFTKIVSGSIESGNTTLEDVKITDLKAGQSVLITFDKETSKPRTVFIIK